MLRRAALLLKLCVVWAWSSALSLTAVGLVKTPWSYLTAAWFWLSLMGQAVTQVWLNHLCRTMRSKGLRGHRLKQEPMGLMAFCSNRQAMFADVALGATATLMAVLLLFRVQLLWLAYLSMSALLLSFQLHCIFNGKNYRYIKAIQTKKKGAEKT